MVYALIIILVLVLVGLYVERQRRLRKACVMVLEALENHDYTFRLSAKGRLFADKALVETLNGLIQRIGEERQDIEVQSWEKLTRILTHEIMNGIAPITSLSDVFLRRKDVQDTPIYDGIKAIHDTSVGLMEFVDSYRKFTTLQQPQPDFFSIRELLEGVKNLGAVPEDITLKVMYDLNTEDVYADKNLIRQVVINIVKNAVESFSKSKVPAQLEDEGVHNAYTERLGPEKIQWAGKNIQIYAYQYEGTPLRIRISNNGDPIPDEVRPDIFVPFFSTKKTGSGIGLALCRQIMRMSGGTLELQRAGMNGWPTSFLLELPVRQTN